MDESKIEFLELKKGAKTLEKEDGACKSPDAKFLKNATNPIMSAFKTFAAAKKFNIKDL